jgi:hypothetical protein
MIDEVVIVGGIAAGLIILFCLLYMLRELRRGRHAKARRIAANIAKLPELLRNP